jgi:rod shape determining protein RodA
MQGRLRNFNWLMFAAMLALVAVGTVAIWSAGNARTEAVFHGMWKANLTTAISGLAVYFALAIADYRKLLSWTAVAAYLVALLLLVAVLVLGSEVYGGRRWLWFFQPSEIAKLCVICMIAKVFGDEERRTFRWFVAGCAIVAVPVLLILMEPDLGTALTLIPATLLMLFVARVWRRGLVTLLAVGGVAVFAVLGAVYEAEKPGVPESRRERILKWVPLKNHQVSRVKVFLFPDEDLTGAGYTLRQAKISIGSGGFSGKGIGKGESNHLKYLPQSISMNDFIFCVYAEETGFVGSLLLLALFGALLVPGAWTAVVASDGSGRLLAIGVSTLVFAHVWINIAMSIGLVPITGLPLPFISSGRTFLVVVMAGFGLIQSVSIHGRSNTK